MSKTNFTPEPWEVHKPEQEPWTKVYSKAPGQVFVIVETYGDDNTEAEANAKLCAAAPDLLQACLQAIGYRLQTHHGDDRCLKILREAIAKATT